jgi:hypothetical protein
MAAKFKLLAPLAKNAAGCRIAKTIFGDHRYLARWQRKLFFTVKDMVF